MIRPDDLIPKPGVTAAHQLLFGVTETTQNKQLKGNMEDKPKKKEISAKRFPDSGEDEVKDPDLKPAKDAKGGGGGGGTRGGGAPLGPGGDPTAAPIGNK